MSAEPERTNEVAQIAQWREDIKKCSHYAKNWQKEWGYLAYPDEKGDSLDTLVKKVQAGQGGGLPANTIAAYVREDKRIEKPPPGRAPRRQRGVPRVSAPAIAQEPSLAAYADSMDKFIGHFIHREKLKLRPPPPKETYKRPILSSQRYGWGNTLECFKDMNMHYR